MDKNPHAVALGKLSAVNRTLLQREQSRINGKNGGRPKIAKKTNKNKA